MAQAKVLISYNHASSAALDRLTRVLKPLQRGGLTYGYGAGGRDEPRFMAELSEGYF